MRRKGAIAGLLPIIAVLILWEAVARSGLLSEFLLPRFSLVALRIAEDAMAGRILPDLGLTLWRALAGFTIASVLGTLLGIAMVRSRWIKWFFDPIISVAFPTPKIAFLPIFMLWLGLGDASKITMVTVACLFVIATNSYAGAAGVERELIWSAKSLGASERAVLFDIVLRAAMPQIITGLQIALPISLIATLVTEMVMSGGGLGGQLLRTSRFADSTGLFAGIVEIALVGAALIHAARFFRARLLSWHAEAHAVQSA